MKKSSDRVFYILVWILILMIGGLAYDLPGNGGQNFIGGFSAENERSSFNSETASIPVGTYTGQSDFPSVKANSADFDSDVIITENTITLIVEGDGTAQGELRSICFTTYEDQSFQDAVIGIISGSLTDNEGQLSISYTWHSYNEGPQCTSDTPCRDDTVNFDFLYNVSVSGNIMKFTPAGEAEDYYSFELTKQSNLDDSEQTADDLPGWIKIKPLDLVKRGEEIYVPDWLDWLKPKANVQGPIKAFIKPREGEEILIYNADTEKWQVPATAGQPLSTGDIVIVGDDTSAEIFLQGEGWMDSIRLADNASLRLPLPEPKTNYPTLWTIYSGAIRAKRTILGETLPPSVPPFSVGDYNAITGARSEFVLIHDQETHTSTYYLINGEIDYYNLIAAGPEDGMITTGQKLTVTADGTETILAFDETELESVLVEYNLKETDPLSQEEIEGLFSEVSDAVNEDVSRNKPINLAIIGAILCVVLILGIGAVIVIIVLISKKKAT